jgi:hypothetical protein
MHKYLDDVIRVLDLPDLLPSWSSISLSLFTSFQSIGSISVNKMRVFAASTIAALAVSSSVSAASVGPWIKDQKPIAKANLLANIGPNGSRAPGAFVCSFLFTSGS